MGKFCGKSQFPQSFGRIERREREKRERRETETETERQRDRETERGKWLGN